MTDKEKLNEIYEMENARGCGALIGIVIILLAVFGFLPK